MHSVNIKIQVCLLSNHPQDCSLFYSIYSTNTTSGLCSTANRGQTNNSSRDL